MKRSFLRLFAVVVLFVSNTGRGAEGSIPGLNAEAQQYVSTHAVKGGDAILNWLMPFSCDVRSYKKNVPHDAESVSGALKMVRALISPGLLPKEWQNETDRLSPIVGDFEAYYKVPNTIIPVYTTPNGAPYYFGIWTHETGGVRLSMLRAAETQMLLVHKASGFQIDVSEGEIATLRDKYFRFPPLELMLPVGWTSTFKILSKDGRFVTGDIQSEYPGKWSDRMPTDPAHGARVGGSWQRNGQFFYDGFTLALKLTALDGPDAAYKPSIPKDLDWGAADERQNDTVPKK